MEHKECVESIHVLNIIDDRKEKEIIEEKRLEEIKLKDKKDREEKLEQRKLLVEKALTRFRALGWHIVYMLHLTKEEYYLDKEGNPTGILLPKDAIDRDKFQTVLGEVVSIGPLSYKAQRLGQEPWVKVGDIIFIDRYKGLQFIYYGIPFLLMQDEQALCQIDDPQEFSTF